jgi:hypothetical protein
LWIQAVRHTMGFSTKPGCTALEILSYFPLVIITSLQCLRSCFLKFLEFGFTRGCTDQLYFLGKGEVILFPGYLVCKE